MEKEVTSSDSGSDDRRRARSRRLLKAKDTVGTRESASSGNSGDNKHERDYNVTKDIYAADADTDVETETAPTSVEPEVEMLKSGMSGRLRERVTRGTSRRSSPYLEEDFAFELEKPTKRSSRKRKADVPDTERRGHSRKKKRKDDRKPKRRQAESGDEGDGVGGKKKKSRRKRKKGDVQRDEGLRRTTRGKSTVSYAYEEGDEDADFYIVEAEVPDQGSETQDWKPVVEEGDEEVSGEDEEDDDNDDEEREGDDVCVVCRDGGELLLCDECNACYHMGCLHPVLTTVPQGAWRCPRCTTVKLPHKIEKILTWRWIEDKPDAMESVIVWTEPNKIREFFVKYVTCSFWQCEWIPEMSLDVYEPGLYRAYCRRTDMTEPPIPDNPDDVVKEDSLQATLYNCGIRLEWLVIQRILNRRKERGGVKYLVKWKEMPYHGCTWEKSDVLPEMGEHIARFKQHRQAVSYDSDPTTARKRNRDSESRKMAKNKLNLCHKYDKQPDFITATTGTLHNYQIEGLNWLRFSWAQGTHTILADEMGLGKTIQTIAFLYSLYKEGLSKGPFLISAPLSTIINWEREFDFWAPDMYVVSYIGSKEDRVTIREHEFSFDSDPMTRSAAKMCRLKGDTRLKFNVLLTSYELVGVDQTVLSSVDWEVLVVDEAHRLKNNQSKFFQVLSQYRVKYRLLLTGTPLQNNLEELFNLLNFLSAKDFNSWEDFSREFADISKEEQVSRLHELLRPHLLRRMKADVMKNIPAKSEFIVRVELSPMQRRFYRYILTRNFQSLNARGSRENVSLLNVVMELKKCCNHPYLFPVAAMEAPHTENGMYEGRALTEASGKFELLAKMLRMLREEGHRVLIFSQMAKVLDLLEDFLEYHQYGYERIDGGVSSTARQMAIDRFNTPGSNKFVFLLTTRAGGLGINLATADTVVIYDSDWNPHMDIQALSRAHRIGQLNKVMIYRFVTRGGVEERIAQVAKRKMLLTHLVESSSRGISMSKRELDDILKFGSKELFEEAEKESDNIGRIVYDDGAVRELLDRSKRGVEVKQTLANEYLSSFKVASYVIRSKDEADEREILKDEVADTDPDYWEKLLRQHWEQQQEIIESTLGKGKRTRKQINYFVEEEHQQEELESWDEAMTDGESESEDISDDELTFKEKPEGKKRRKVGNDKPLPPLLVRVGDSVEVLGFNARQRRAFHNAVMRYGMPSANSFQSHWLSKDLRTKSEKEFNAYVSLFMRHLVEPTGDNEETFRDGIPRDGLPRHATLARIGVMKLIRRKVMEYANVNGQNSIPASLLQQISHTTAPTPQPPPPTSTTSTSNETPATATSTTAVDTTAPASNVSEPKAEQAEKVVSNTEGGDKQAGQQVEISKSDVVIVEFEKDDVHETASQERAPDVELILESVSGKSNSDLWQKIKAVPFMFNIADGGFTELHGLWEHEEKIQNFGTWSRRHDYWLLAGIAVRGYARWNEILADTRFALLTLPFKEQGTPVDVAAKFMSRRFKLLEQALAVEEQIKRASYLGITQSGNDPVMTLQNRFSEVECLVETHQNLIKEAHRVGPAALLRRVFVQIDDLLSEMKNELSRLPNHLSRLQPVQNRLQMDEWRIMSKLTSRQDIVPSRITPRPPHPGHTAAPSHRPTGTVTLHPPSVISHHPSPSVSIPATVIATVRPQAQNMIHTPLASVVRYQPSVSNPGYHHQSGSLPTPPILTRHVAPVGTVPQRHGQPPTLMGGHNIDASKQQGRHSAYDAAALQDVLRYAKTGEEKAVVGIATGIDSEVQSALRVAGKGKSSGTKEEKVVVTLDE